MNNNMKTKIMKVCTVCKVEKEYNSDIFTVDKRSKYGLGGQCRECKRKDSIERRLKKGGNRKKVWDLYEVRKLANSKGLSVLVDSRPDETVIKTRDKLTFYCNCGNDFDRSFNKFKDSKRYNCIECSNEVGFSKQRKSQEQFVNEMFEVKGSEFSVLGNYTGYSRKVKFKHSVCNRAFETTPGQFLSQDQGCPLCRDDNRWKYRQKTHAQFAIEFEEVMDNDYKLLSKYVGASDKITVLHKECGKEYVTTPDKVLQGTKCTNPQCISKRISDAALMTHEDYVASFTEALEEDYKLVSKYKGSNEGIRVLHETCGTTWTANTSRFRSGTRCPKCSLDSRRIILSKTIEEFKSEVSALVGEEYTVMGEYRNNMTPLEVRHNHCGNVYHVTPGKFLSNRRCPQCSSSRGEGVILDYLNRKGIGYVHQAMFEGLMLERQLRVDFYIPSGNLIVEYDGEQHYRVVEHWGGLESFEGVKLRDNIKNEYAKENGIGMLRIPYWELNNVDDILSKALGEVEADPKQMVLF